MYFQIKTLIMTKYCGGMIYVLFSMSSSFHLDPFKVLLRAIA